MIGTQQCRKPAKSASKLLSPDRIIDALKLSNEQVRILLNLVQEQSIPVYRNSLVDEQPGKQNDRSRIGPINEPSGKKAKQAAVSLLMNSFATEEGRRVLEQRIHRSQSLGPDNFTRLDGIQNANWPNQSSFHGLTPPRTSGFVPQYERDCSKLAIEDNSLENISMSMEMRATNWFKPPESELMTHQLASRQDMEMNSAGQYASSTIQEVSTDPSILSKQNEPFRRHTHVTFPIVMTGTSWPMELIESSNQFDIQSTSPHAIALEGCNFFGNAPTVTASQFPELRRDYEPVPSLDMSSVNGSYLLSKQLCDSKDNGLSNASLRSSNNSFRTSSTPFSLDNQVFAPSSLVSPSDGSLNFELLNHNATMENLNSKIASSTIAPGNKAIELLRDTLDTEKKMKRQRGVKSQPRQPQRQAPLNSDETTTDAAPSKALLEEAAAEEEKLLQMAMERVKTVISPKTGEKETSYPCPGCDAVFDRIYNLKSHIRSHLTIRPYKCTSCTAAFSRNHDLCR
jgi:hypothetical protein